MGYCGLDSRRQPLVGDEIRPCWEARPSTAGATVTDQLTIRPAEATRKVERIEFVEVREPTADDAPAAIGEPPVVPPGPIAPAAEPGWNLWGDLDR
jgi:hypothetical protein